MARSNKPLRCATLLRKDAAQRIGVSTRTLQTWEKEGRGPPFARANRRVFYPVDALNHWLKARNPPA